MKGIKKELVVNGRKVTATFSSEKNEDAETYIKNFLIQSCQALIEKETMLISNRHHNIS